ncbi:ABC transporter related protein [Desulfurispirillum indicum S5]|uniref:ABC transporter related protein n=1 Tax=Desulfurispirillum indicum (strain ATCC BAA-1389 / DSM 22839 / S5) TaxID=653733 RepID=E6W0G0_DESIS|nr:ABC transporter related protein [Desulfurispirillum indicum S5]
MSGPVIRPRLLDSTHGSSVQGREGGLFGIVLISIYTSSGNDYHAVIHFQTGRIVTIAIDIRNLSFTYEERQVLHDINLQVHEGDFLGIVGPNGSGKSTLLKLILGLLRPGEGSITLFGEDSLSFTQRHRIGYIAQRASSVNLGFPATVSEIVASGLLSRQHFLGRLKPVHKESIQAAIRMVGLAPHSDQMLGKLSGGQQQRVFIARALVSEPELMIFDEPTAGVDGESMERFYQLLEDLHCHHGKTMILVSHDIGVITTRVNKVACLNRELYFHGDNLDFIAQQESILDRAYRHSVQVISHGH